MLLLDKAYTDTYVNKLVWIITICIKYTHIYLKTWMRRWTTVIKRVRDKSLNETKEFLVTSYRLQGISRFRL